MIIVFRTARWVASDATQRAVRKSMMRRFPGVPAVSAGGRSGAWEVDPLAMGLAGDFGHSRYFRYRFFARTDGPARLRPGAVDIG